MQVVIIFDWNEMMSGHHLVMGEVVDYLTGKILPETHDERYRQKLARFIVEKKGYLKEEIYSRYRLLLSIDNKRATIPVDFQVVLSGRTCMMIKYAPGSLVTRRRCVLAVSRILSAYQIPVAVVTNGEDAEVLDASAGSIIGEGLDSIPSKENLKKLVREKPIEFISRDRYEMESRIAYAMEVDGSCPCDDTICRL